jgi:hypothetical protein
MKAILVNVPNPLKKKLDGVRKQGYSVNGYVRAVLEQSLARPDDLNSLHLSKKDITKLEEALNTDDLEFLVAAVDRMLGHRVKPRPNQKRAIR